MLLLHKLPVTLIKCKFNRMIFRSSIKGTIGHATESDLPGRDSNRDPDCYQANSVDASNGFNNNNNNSNNNLHNSTDLSDDSLRSK